MDTWFTWLHCAPAEAIIVVSEIGEQWSPQTAPAMQAEMEIIISCGLESANTATTIGISMPKVPQEVPVENARKQPTRKIIAGRKFIREPAVCYMASATNSAAPRLSVIAFRVQAKVRINIAGTMALNPSGKHSIHWVKLKTLRMR